MSASIIPIARKPQSKPWMGSKSEWNVLKYNWRGQKRPVDPTDDLISLPPPFDFPKDQIREGLPQLQVINSITLLLFFLPNASTVPQNLTVLKRNQFLYTSRQISELWPLILETCIKIVEPLVDTYFQSWTFVNFYIWELYRFEILYEIAFLFSQKGNQIAIEFRGNIYPYSTATL